METTTTTTDDGLVIVSSDPAPPPAAAPEVETPPAAPALEAEPDADPAPAPEADDEPDRPVSGREFQRFVARTTRQRGDLEREVSTLKGQNEALMRLMQGAQQPPGDPGQPPGPPQRPRPEAYATDEEYEQALDHYDEARFQYRFVEQQALERQRAFEQQQAQEFQTREQAFREREQAIARQYPTYYDRAQDLSPQLAPQVYQALLNAGADGPDLVLHLMQHPDEVQRLNQLPWHEMGYALGVIRAANGGTPPTRPNGQPPPAPNRLPPPMQPISGASASVTPGYRDDMTQAQFDEWAKRTFPGMSYTHRR